MPTRLSSAFSTRGNSGASMAPTVSVAVGQGQAMTIHYYTDTITTTSVTQTNCSWSMAIRQTVASVSATEVWYCVSAGSSPGTTVTIATSGISIAAAVVATYDTAFQITPVDKTAVYSGGASSNPSTGTTATTTITSELWVGGSSIRDVTAVGYAFGTPTNGFSIVREGDAANLVPNFLHYTYLDNIVTSTGAAGTTGSLLVAVNTGAIAALSFVPTTVPGLTLLGVGI